MCSLNIVIKTRFRSIFFFQFTKTVWGKGIVVFREEIIEGTVVVRKYTVTRQGTLRFFSVNVLYDKAFSFKSLNGDEDPIHIINVCIKSGSSTMEKQEEEKEQFQSIINKRVSNLKKIISHFVSRGVNNKFSHRHL